MNSGINRFMPRLAKQLLVRQHSNWTGDEAKKTVKATLMAMQESVASADFRKLVACAYRVGTTLDTLDNLYKSVPWDIVKLRDSLQNWLAARGCVAEAGGFIESLAATIKSYDFSTPQTLDWVNIINRLRRHSRCEGILPDLSTKLSLADFVQEILERRLGELVAYAENELEVTVQQIVTAICSVAEEYEPKYLARSAPTQSQATTRLTKAEVDELAAFVHDRVQADFRQWIERLSPGTQRAMQRRLSQLQSEPLVYRLWVKPILGTKVTALRELKFVSDGIHFRVIFQTTTGSRILVLSFGLRRDLGSLIERADAIAVLVS